MVCSAEGRVSRRSASSRAAPTALDMAPPPGRLLGGVRKWETMLQIIAMGMAMKILLANPMGHVADRAFDAAGLA